MAQVEHGDPAIWATTNKISSEEHLNLVRNFFDKYIQPYMKISKIYGYKTYADMNLIYKDKSNNDLFTLGQGGLFFADNKGSIYCLAYSGRKDENDEIYFAEPYLYVDINGTKGPNIQGIDLFGYIFDGNTGILKFNGEGQNRTQLYNICKTTGLYCGALLKYDGWQIADKELWEY